MTIATAPLTSVKTETTVSEPVHYELLQIDNDNEEQAEIEPPDPSKVTLSKCLHGRFDGLVDLSNVYFFLAAAGVVATSAGIGLSSSLIARSIVRFISETTAGTSRLFTSPTSETALLQTVAPVTSLSSGRTLRFRL